MGQSILPPGGGGDEIEPVDLKKALEERYLAYALSTIMHRALPDVRDGLKPVHRRIVYAMREMGLRPNSSHKKSAKHISEVRFKDTVCHGVYPAPTNVICVTSVTCNSNEISPSNV